MKAILHLVHLGGTCALSMQQMDVGDGVDYEQRNEHKTFHIARRRFSTRGNIGLHHDDVMRDDENAAEHGSTIKFVDGNYPALSWLYVL